MFNQTQIESYQNITASADLKERVFQACQNTKEKRIKAPTKTIYQLAPLVACLILCFTFFLRSDPQTFYLMSGEIMLDTHNMQLPKISQETDALVRTISLEPTLYTVSLQTSPDTEILSADGDVTLDEEGNLLWTVIVPGEDTIFTLTLQAGNDTYLVPLTYHSQDGSFSICCLNN